VSEEKKHLEALYEHVHPKVRGLKMGEIGAISCTREFPINELRWYLFAYAGHKNKWFKVTHDAVSNVVYAKRVERPIAVKHERDDEEVE